VLFFLRPETCESNSPADPPTGGKRKGIAALSGRNGFTLSEVLVAMAISGIVMSAAYGLFISQQRSYSSQEEIAAIQKNLSAAMYFLERDIRMAGCDPTGRAMAGIKAAEPSSIRITMDIRGGGSAEFSYADGACDDPNEDITYSLYTSSGVNRLGRKSSLTASNQPVAENIESLHFVYLDDKGDITDILSDIRSVQITVKAGTPKPGTGEMLTRSLTKQVKCRNLYF
jgi:type IV pilus assembly protein PilW